MTQDKYDFMTCKEIVGQRANLISAREGTGRLVAKAEASPGGFIVSYSAYRSELAQVRGQIAAANRAAAEKRLRSRRR